MSEQDTNKFAFCIFQKTQNKYVLKRSHPHRFNFENQWEILLKILIDNVNYITRDRIYNLHYIENINGNKVHYYNTLQELVETEFTEIL